MKQIKPLMQREKPAWRQFEDIEGETLGRLKVISYAGCRETLSGKTVHYWNCKCKCGSECVISHHKLRHGRSKSCGCSRIGKATKHGGHICGKMTREYATWKSMKNMCLQPECISYKYYGGRGISICDSWHYSFENFLSDVGSRPDGSRLGRIDKNGNFEPGNCKWMTRSEILKGSRKMPAKEEAA